MTTFRRPQHEQPTDLFLLALTMDKGTTLATPSPSQIPLSHTVLHDSGCTSIQHVRSYSGLNKVLYR